MVSNNSTSVITTKLRTKNAKLFANNYINSNDLLYLFTGRSYAWDDEEIPPIANDSVQTTEYDHWRDMLNLKKISTSDIQYVIPRIDWEAGKVFDMYRNDENSFTGEGTWIHGGIINVGRSLLKGCGTQSNSLISGGYVFTTLAATPYCEIYDGTLWSSTTSLNTARYSHSMCGYADDALVAGGYGSSSILNTTEIFNGTTWSSSANINTARYKHVSSGTTSSSLICGGQSDSSTYLNTTESFNGTSWSASDAFNTERSEFAGGGITSSTIIFGGKNSSTDYIRTTEEYDGTSWTTGGNLLTARNDHGGVALNVNKALCFAGKNTNGLLGQTEEYNGEIWSAKSVMNVKRWGVGSSGTHQSALAVGGRKLLDLHITEEFDKSISGEESLLNKEYYVLTDEYKVYKCLDNNGGTSANDKPTSTTTTGTFETSDGYLWKYMYTLTATDQAYYLTNDWIPVRYLTSDNGTTQWDVQSNASNGSIDVIEVLSSGQNYDYHSGNVQVVTNSTVFALDTGGTYQPSNQDDHYVKSVVYIYAGTGEGQVRNIVDYDGTNKTITVNTAFTTGLVQNDSKYKIIPQVKIEGDGSDAFAVSNVSSNTVTSIEVLNTGSDYSRNVDVNGDSIVTILANSGSGAVATPIIPPRNGHGSNPLEELYGFNVMVFSQLSGSESNNFSVTNDFRKFGLLENPIATANDSLYEETYADGTLNIKLTGLTGEPAPDKVITGQTSGANGIIVDYNIANNDYVRITSRNDIDFTVGETINTQNSSSGVVSGTVDTIDDKDLIDYKGDVFYVTNRESVSRANSQVEEFHIVFQF